MRRANFSSMVRPTITLMLVSVFCGMVVMNWPMPEVFSTLVISVTSYWFGERSKGK